MMQEKKITEEIPVRYIKGVGPKRSDLFKKLGIESVQDLFYYLPRRYEDRTCIVRVGELKVGDEAGVVGEVLKVSSFNARTGTSISEIELGDETGRIKAVWYNMPFIRGTFKKGDKVLLYGKVELYDRPQISHPVFEVLREGEEKESLEIGRIVPVYSLIQDISQRYMRKTVNGAIQSYLTRAGDAIPTNIRARKKLVDFKFAIENIHFPHSADNLAKAYRRLVFEEFFVLQLLMAMRRRKARKKGISHELKEGLLEDFEKLFTFQFTPDQKICISEIEKDMASEKPMHRLLQGDVGSGKTVVAMYAMLIAASNGYQSVIMAPTEILARQHYVTISKTFMPLGLNVRLLTGGLDDNTKKSVKEEITRGDVDIVVGTHSVFQEKVDYKRLGLVIIDEQHKFGVEQRKALKEKNAKADTLVMTATPIPRSFALTVYGDMDVSLLKEKPLERRDVATYWVDETRREAVYKFVREEVDSGRQAFFVCPRVKKGADSGMVSAEEMHEALKKSGALSGLSIALIHGKMKTGDKDRVMAAFKDKKHDILVASTVVEVGVDVPNATCMVIEHADRYGLAQLHQLRGRIGRGRHDSYCILIGTPKNEDSHERLSTISEVNDGFQIAEKDLDIRGPGEFFGTRQSGLPELRFGNIMRDFKIMEEAREEAFGLVEDDPELRDPRHAEIKKNIDERFRGTLTF